MAKTQTRKTENNPARTSQKTVEDPKPPKITEQTPGAVATGTKGILNVTGVPIATLHPESEAPVNPTSPSKGYESAVEALHRAVEKADGTIGHSEILAVVNRKLVDVQGERDVLI